jgi:hypothetical protein
MGSKFMTRKKINEQGFPSLKFTIKFFSFAMELLVFSRLVTWRGLEQLPMIKGESLTNQNHLKS